MMYKGCSTITASVDTTPKISKKNKFYCLLTEELMDTNQDKVQIGSRRRVDSHQNLVSISSVQVLRATIKQKSVL